MVTDLLIGMYGDENEDGEHEEEGNRMKGDGDDDVKKCMDHGLCNIHPVRILAGTFLILLKWQH